MAAITVQNQNMTTPSPTTTRKSPPIPTKKPDNVFRNMIPCFKKTTDAKDCFTQVKTKLESSDQKFQHPLKAIEAACKEFEKIEKTGLNSSRLHKQSGFEILIFNHNGYFLDYSIHRTEEKEIFSSIDLKTRKCKAILKSSLESTSSISKEEFNKLHALSCQKGSGILPFLDLASIGDSQFLVQKLCKDGDLLDAIEKQKLNPEEKKAIAMTIVKAVILLSGEGFNVTDLKPDNIFLHKGKALLGDINPKASNYETFCYSPPEAILGRENKVSDTGIVWSVGQTLHFLLSGKPTEIAVNLRECSKSIQEMTSELTEAGLSDVEIEQEKQNILGLFSEESLKDLLPWEKTSDVAGLNPGEKLVHSMLRFDPRKRITLSDVLTLMEKTPPKDLIF